MDFPSVLTAISKQIYDTPHAFIRENVQNAVDAVRIQVRRDARGSAVGLAVHVTARPDVVTIHDSGIGMSLTDLKNLFWTIGASGKRTPEARAAGCVGMFGIGGFANFGVCSELYVTSQSTEDPIGHETKLTRLDIDTSGGVIPDVTVKTSLEVAPRGTLVKGVMSTSIDVNQLERYLRDVVKYVEESVYFNEQLISGQSYTMATRYEDGDRALDDTPQEWVNGRIVVQGQFFQMGRRTLSAKIMGLRVNGTPVRLKGWLRFENGRIDVLKRGFKLCSTAVGTQVGISGSLDCDELFPTAGRDSLNPESSALIVSIVACMERAAVYKVLDSSDLIRQHTRIFRYVTRNGLVGKIGKTIVELADGRETKLEDIQRQSSGGVRIFFAVSRNSQLAHLLQTRGHIVVQLPYNTYKQRAVRDFLISFCQAESFEGRVECIEHYGDLSRFERYFLSELEEAILNGFAITTAELVAGRLSEDIPVCTSDYVKDEITIFVDVRHPEIMKLSQLGITSLFRSMVAAFCREYLGPMLKTYSPIFFGSGAMNLDFLSKRRSELWVLVTKDIETLVRSAQRQVVRSSDVQVVQAGTVGSEQLQSPKGGQYEPKLVVIRGSEEFSDLFGYYLRIPKSASVAYGDVILQCEERAAVWAGNGITLFASDGISTAFHFYVHLDQLIIIAGSVASESSGALQMKRPVQALYGGLYFPIPSVLESFLVPGPNQEIRIEVQCEWTDYSTARTWEGA